MPGDRRDDLLAACAQQAPRDDGLYRALGEEPGIVRIVEGMLLGSARDPRIARHFLDIDIERLREKLIEQLCFESGGPCVYTGDSMEESHKGLRLTPSDFNALVEHLQDAIAQILDKNKVTGLTAIAVDRDRLARQNLSEEQSDCAALEM